MADNGIKPVKNRERSAARFFAAFGIISLSAAAASLSENNFLSGIWPVSFLGIFAGAASLVTIFILNKRAKKMDRLLSGERLIANWIMTDDEKKVASWDYLIGPGDNINIIVWRNPEIKYGIGKLQVAGKGHSEGCIRRQDHNAAVILTKTELGLRADHAF